MLLHTAELLLSILHTTAELYSLLKYFQVAILYSSQVDLADIHFSREDIALS